MSGVRAAVRAKKSEPRSSGSGRECECEWPRGEPWAEVKSEYRGVGRRVGREVGGRGVGDRRVGGGGYGRGGGE